MSVTQVFTVQPQVLGGTVVSIEADLSRGLHSFSIVGLAGKAIEEAKDQHSVDMERRAKIALQRAINRINVGNRL